MNANRKRNTAVFLMIAPLMLGAAALATQAHAGTITISGFATPARTLAALGAAEGAMFNAHTGTITAYCGGKLLPVSEGKPLYRVNAEIIKACPRGLSVTMTTEPFGPGQIATEEKADRNLFRASN